MAADSATAGSRTAVEDAGRERGAAAGDAVQSFALGDARCRFLAGKLRNAPFAGNVLDRAFGDLGFRNLVFGVDKVCHGKGFS